MGCRVFAARALWVLGYPDQALQRSQEALTLAHELSHPFSLALCPESVWLGSMSCRREWPAAQERAEALTGPGDGAGICATGCAIGLVLLGLGARRAGAGRGGHRPDASGPGRLSGHGGRDRHGRGSLPGWLRPMGQGARPGEGLHVLAEAVAAVDTTGERSYEAERHRLKGSLLLRRLSRTHQAEAEACFQQALDVARRQQAKSWELRAAMSLSRLWQQQGKRADARELLAPIYGWFTEGFDTADLQDARALLEELAVEGPQQ